MRSLTLLGIVAWLLLATRWISAENTPQLCLLAFHDKNGNGVQDWREPLAANVKIAVLDAPDNAYYRYWTNGQSEPHCLTNVPEGTYTIRFEENGTSHLTTPIEQQVHIELYHDVTTIAFGGEFHPTEIGATSSQADTVQRQSNGWLMLPLVLLLWLIVMMPSHLAFMLGIRSKIGEIENDQPN